MSDHEQTNPRLLGSLASVAGHGVVAMEDRFAADPDTVWKALTDKAALANWLGDFTGELAAGSTVHAHFHSSGAEGARRIDACEAPVRFRVTGLDESGHETQVVEVALKADGDGTVVTLIQSGLRLDWIAAFGAGMQVHFEDLALHLAGQERSDSDARMGELIPAYAKQGAAAV